MSLVVLGGGHLLPCPTPTCLQLKGDPTPACWGRAFEVDVDCRSAAMVVRVDTPAAASASLSTEKDVTSAAHVIGASSTAADSSEAAVASVSGAASADAAQGSTAGQGRQMAAPAQASRARTRPGASSVAADGAPDTNRQTSKPDISVLASAVAAAKLGLVEQLSQALATCAAVAYAKCVPQVVADVVVWGLHVAFAEPMATIIVGIPLVLENHYHHCLVTVALIVERTAERSPCLRPEAMTRARSIRTLGFHRHVTPARDPCPPPDKQRKQGCRGPQLPALRCWLRARGVC